MNPHGTPGHSPAETTSLLPADDQNNVTVALASEAQPAPALAETGDTSAERPSAADARQSASPPAEKPGATGPAPEPSSQQVTGGAAIGSAAKQSGAIVTSAPRTDPIVPHAISEAQSAVLAALCDGKSIAAAAAQAGVSRSTIYRWNSDPDFAAALNAWKRQTRESAHHRLLALGDLAVSTVHRALKESDTRTAMALLRELGILRRVAAGSSDRDEVRAKILLKEFQKDVARRKRFNEGVKEGREVKSYADMFRLRYPWDESRDSPK